ncbi:hypothetical protein [Paenibacillus xanthanilyticus]|uniref:Uncharacterized protein n=1 Tax=Paenibacillus xanthanilyticus TaxID=1783531 RepID=A0ABV8K0V5_9BACL
MMIWVGGTGEVIEILGSGMDTEFFIKFADKDRNTEQIEVRPLINAYLPSLLIGGACAVLRVLFGVPIYMNTFASLPSFGTTFLVHFLWGVPALLVVLGAMVLKNARSKMWLLSSLAWTVLITCVPSWLE